MNPDQHDKLSKDQQDILSLLGLLKEFSLSEDAVITLIGDIKKFLTTAGNIVTEEAACLIVQGTLSIAWARTVADEFEQHQTELFAKRNELEEIAP